MRVSRLLCTKKLWGGRFTGATDPLMESFNDSFPYDQRMWAADIQGSLVYVEALHACTLLDTAEAEKLTSG